ncbi:hypothetical protein H4S07_002390 [Coemansia furcata]|uniref:Uncharacterized protein n=1 Tax=Coemansia furcata TaxID=417177 RepID=A0ACC1LKJ3_9FUNG|nr:hypothetical protein H4S07_002390 [Coemansia furcata]
MTGPSSDARHRNKCDVVGAVEVEVDAVEAASVGVEEASVGVGVEEASVDEVEAAVVDEEVVDEVEVDVGEEAVAPTITFMAGLRLFHLEPGSHSQTSQAQYQRQTLND